MQLLYQRLYEFLDEVSDYLYTRDKKLYREAVELLGEIAKWIHK
jgi:hypothetical protein